MPSAKSQIGEAAAEHFPHDQAAPEFEFGVTRFFGRGDLSDCYFDGGWAAPEENHSWNDGIDVAILVPVKSAPKKPCVLKVRGVPNLNDAIRLQDVTLYVNGHRAGFWRMEMRQTTALTARIEPEFWVERNGHGLARCVFHIPGSARPSESSGVNDKRQLGFCFQDLTIDVLPG